MTDKHDVDDNAEVGPGETTAEQTTPSKPVNRRSRKSDCRYRLTGLLAKHGHISYDGAKRISYGTSRSRSFILLQGFEYLDEIGMCPRKPENFKPKHLAKLVQHWEEQGLAASTLQLRFSIFSTFCTWIGKKGMPGDITQYLTNPNAAKRTYVATKDKSWSTQGVDVQAKFAEVAARNPRAALVLKVMHAFGVRIREAVTIHPKEADLGTAVDVAWGTKGDRPRVLKIENDYQRQVLEEAKQFVNRSTGSIIPDTFKRDSWITYLYTIFRKCGISVKNGLVPHGLRHQRANDMLESLTGEKTPVRGGEAPADKEADKHARLVVAEALGHSRVAITGAYVGKATKKKESKER